MLVGALSIRGISWNSANGADELDPRTVKYLMVLTIVFVSCRRVRICRVVCQRMLSGPANGVAFGTGIGLVFAAFRASATAFDGQGVFRSHGNLSRN